MKPGERDGKQRKASTFLVAFCCCGFFGGFPLEEFRAGFVFQEFQWDFLDTIPCKRAVTGCRSQNTLQCNFNSAPSLQGMH